MSRLTPALKVEIPPEEARGRRGSLGTFVHGTAVAARPRKRQGSRPRMPPPVRSTALPAPALSTAPSRPAPSTALPPPKPRATLSRVGSTVAVELEGELDLAAQLALHGVIERALTRSPAVLSLDLSRVTFIDCSGLRIIVEAADRCASRNARLTIVPGPAPVQRFFEILELTAVLPFASGDGGQLDAPNDSPRRDGRERPLPPPEAPAGTASGPR
jgi:anti-sigma B factor antagonist